VTIASGAVEAGVSKYRINQMTGIGRSTIDRILAALVAQLFRYAVPVVTAHQPRGVDLLAAAWYVTTTASFTRGWQHTARSAAAARG
jgi:hypothetical protein